MKYHFTKVRMQKRIQLTKEIKTLGTFKVKINLHSEVQSEVSISVVQEETIQ